MKELPKGLAEPKTGTQETPSKPSFKRLLGGETQEPVFLMADASRQSPPITPPRRPGRPNLPMAPHPSAPVRSTRSLRDLAAELLKPKLRRWVDQNLQGVVEEMVRDEIKRIARAARSSSYEELSISALVDNSEDPSGN
jgi:hypothetical protein